MTTSTDQIALNLSIKSDHPDIETGLSVGAKTGFIFIIVLSLAMMACSDKVDPPPPANVPLSSGPVLEPTTKVLGVEAAGPTRDPATTTSPSKSDVSKDQQSTAMPMPGQANDHSVLLPKPVQAPASR